MYQVTKMAVVILKFVSVCVTLSLDFLFHISVSVVWLFSSYSWCVSLGFSCNSDLFSLNRLMTFDQRILLFLFFTLRSSNLAYVNIKAGLHNTFLFDNCKSLHNQITDLNKKCLYTFWFLVGLTYIWCTTFWA